MAGGPPQHQAKMRSSYEQERWQVEHAHALARQRLLASAVAQHALVLIDGLAAGAFKSTTMRTLVMAEQRWKDLAGLHSGSTVVESLSNLLVQHVEDGAALPGDSEDLTHIGSQCMRAHHGPPASQHVALQRIAGITGRHFQHYAHLLTNLARLEPRSDAWYECAAHTINAAVALGSHLDWVASLRSPK